MSSIYSSCEDVCQEAESLSLETTALLLSPKYTTAIDSALVYMGLESTTSLNQYISQEGLFSWVKQKLAKLGRKVSVAVNKIYAKLTRADKATKALIERASKDDTVQLPISGKQIATIGTLAAAAATVIAVTCVALSSGKKEDRDKSKSLFDKFKGMFKKNDSEDKPEKVKSGIVKTALTKVRKAIASIYNSIKEFFARFKKTGTETEAAAKAQDKTENKGILGKLKGIGEGIKRIFSTISDLFKRWLNRFKDTPTDGPRSRKPEICKEEQVLVFDTPARTLQEHGIDVKSYVEIFGSSQSCKACSKTEWDKIAKKLGLGSPLNSIPEDPNQLVFGVFTVPAHKRKIKNDKGAMMSNCRRLLGEGFAQKAVLYKKPLLDKHMEKYGFIL